MGHKRYKIILVCVVIWGTLLAAGQEGAQRPRPMYVNPVIAGDFPDPSIIRTGDDFWATSTSSEWAPVFRLMHSRDLVNWTQVGAVFDAPPRVGWGQFLGSGDFRI